jgi:hypothetical protein
MWETPAEFIREHARLDNRTRFEGDVLVWSE